MNFSYKIYDASCVDIFKYIFHWRSTKISATDNSKINTFHQFPRLVIICQTVREISHLKVFLWLILALCELEFWPPKPQSWPYHALATQTICADLHHNRFVFKISFSRVWQQTYGHKNLNNNIRRQKRPQDSVLEKAGCHATQYGVEKVNSPRRTPYRDQHHCQFGKHGEQRISRWVSHLHRHFTDRESRFIKSVTSSSITHTETTQTETGMIYNN